MDTLTPDQRRLMTFGLRPGQLERDVARHRARLLGKNMVMAQVAPGGARLEADDESGLFDEISEDADASKIASEGKKHLERFLAAPEEKDAHEHLARASAMLAAALSRCARDNANTSKINSGRGLTR